MITIATLPQATEQEVFDQVANHLLTQGRKCMSVGGACRYRNMEDGTACAAGCLISEEEYINATDKKHYTNLFEGNGGWRSVVDAELAPANHADLIIELQLIHDKASVLEWRECLINCANRNNLSTANLIPETNE